MTSTQPLDEGEAELVRAAMKGHEHLAPGVEPLLRSMVESEPPRQRPRYRTGLVTLGSVAAVLGVILGIRLLDGAESEVHGPSGYETTGSSTSIPTPTSALLDPLTYQLTLNPPAADGAMTSKLKVTNRSNSVVIDPGCLHSANFWSGVSAPGVAMNHEAATRTMTKCGGTQRLKPGYSVTVDGPTFDTSGLAAGRYEAVIDFGSHRTEDVRTQWVQPRLTPVDDFPSIPLTACSELLRTGWVPEPTDPDISLDSSGDLAVFTFGKDQVKVNIRTDSACAEVPEIGTLIEQILDD